MRLHGASHAPVSQTTAGVRAIATINAIEATFAMKTAMPAGIGTGRDREPGMIYRFCTNPPRAFAVNNAR